MLANEELKPVQEEGVHLSIKGKDIVSLLPSGFGKRLIYHLVPLVAKVGSIAIPYWSVQSVKG